MNLFRKEAWEAQRRQWLGSINLATPLGFVWWACLAAALATAIVLFLIFGHYTRRATVSGKLEPKAGLLTLSAKTTGTVTRTLVHEGEKVAAGQRLVEVSANLVSARMGNTYAAVSQHLRARGKQVRTTLASLQPLADAQRKDLQARIGILQKQIHQIENQLAKQRKRAKTATRMLDNIRPLHRQGIISTVKFDQYQAQALEQQSQVDILKRQQLDLKKQSTSLQSKLTQLPLNTASQSNQLQNQLAQIEVELAKNEAARGTVLRAPHAGTVATLLVKAGQYITSGQPVLSILPKGSKLQAQLLVPSSAIGFVAHGNRVVLRYQAYPYQKFGQQYGKVVQVSRSALSPAGAASLLGRNIVKPMYRVLVALDRQSIDAYGKRQTLKPGMALNADILLDRRSLWQWAFAPLYGLRQHVMTEGTSHG